MPGSWGTNGWIMYIIMPAVRDLDRLFSHTIVKRYMHKLNFRGIWK